MPYLDRTCVVGFEFDYGLSAAGYLDLVLRAEPRHHCSRTVSNPYPMRLCVSWFAAHL